MASLSITLPLSSSYPNVAASRNSSSLSSSTSVRKPPATVVIPSILRNYGGLSLRQSNRRSLQVVRMAPDEEKMTRRSPLDFPIEWERPKPGRRPDIFPQFSPMKTPIPPPMPCDPPEEDEEDEEEKKEEEEEDPEKEEDPSKPE